MFSRALLRSSLRTLPRTLPRALPKSPIPPPRRQPLSLTTRRCYAQYPQPPRKPPRIIHTRFNPEEIHKAKPLLTSEQIFNTIQHPRTKWVVVIICGSAIVFYVSNLEEVPVSGRWRFNCYSDATVEKEGQRMYTMIMDQYKRELLPTWDRRTQMVLRVMEKLIPASGLEDVNWEVHVIDSPDANAFVIPGGKVFVYTGMLPICGNDDGLAAVLGHEIAHNLARHASESMSSLVLLQPIRWLFIFLDTTGYTMGLGRVLGDMAMELGIARPASRKQESEADYIGLMMMAKSCYDPSEAVRVWERMERAQKDKEVPEWLSTHPSNANRIGTMQKWLPKAEEERSSSECHVTLGYAQEFQAALGGMGGWGGIGIFKN